MTQIRLILAIIGVGAIGLLGWWIYNQGYAASEAANKEALLLAEQENREQSEAFRKKVRQIGQEHEDELRELENNLASADTAFDRLLDTVRNANAGGGSAATCQSDAATARTLLAQCASEYRNVARDADRLRATVLGLQEYARSITQSE